MINVEKQGKLDERRKRKFLQIFLNKILQKNSIMMRYEQRNQNMRINSVNANKNSLTKNVLTPFDELKENIMHKIYTNIHKNG